ncbi:hypothetical protein H7F15_15310 [Pontibacter sp. Tf4]|uniref:hypothetical protein n=1 Tax=Pontibacter sp. Tf4 TaxID=2761620 RepID=UPI0016263470|nr:hypothetical protein [Pontibacter sp. Tf4]MBB6612414.1 hypothetical protein [Pontibacter sp. Tf4]
MEDRPLRDKKAIQQLYNDVLPALAQQVHQGLQPVLALFENFTLERLLDTRTKDPADPEKEVSIENGNVQLLGLKLRLEGFNKPGTEPFDLTKDLLFKLHYNYYGVGPDKENTWLEKNYLERWQTAETQTIASQFCDAVIDGLTERLNK